jgi:hypothetical protein
MKFKIMLKNPLGWNAKYVKYTKKFQN